MMQSINVMKHRHFATFALGLLIASGVLHAAPADCNRDCLSGFVTKYLDALVAHSPVVLPLSDKARFTEDSVEAHLGDGLWKTATRLGGYRQDVLDTRQGVAASQIIVEESGSPALLTLRLKVAGGKITEIETMVTHNQKEGALFKPDALQSADKNMLAAPDKSQLATRDDAVRIAKFYPAGLKIGSFVTVDAPFAADAYRIENGFVTAGPGCSRPGCENIKTQKIMEHPSITTRVVAVDEELGIVLLRMNFGQTGAYGQGNALIVWEEFKVYGGQIHAVEAFMKIMPANMGSGWD
jgi:hypothetical protein